MAMPSQRVTQRIHLILFLLVSSACTNVVHSRLLAAERSPPLSPASTIEPESPMEAQQPSEEPTASSPTGTQSSSPIPIRGVLDSQNNGGVPPEWLRDSAFPPSISSAGDVVVVSLNPASGSSDVPQVAVQDSSEPIHFFPGVLRAAPIPTESPAASPSDSESPSPSLPPNTLLRGHCFNRTESRVLRY